MGNGQSTPTSVQLSVDAHGGPGESKQPSPPSGCPVSKAPVTAASKCPLGFGGSVAPDTAASAVPQTAPLECPVKRASDSGDGCPVKHSSAGSGYKYKDVFNVYSQKIDSRNNMPSTANQQPAPGQQVPLSTERVQSQIPKGGTAEDTWLYPSPQMFWNAMVRKNKLKDSEEEIKQVETVVAIHNNMNEKTWAQIMAWESMHVAEDGPADLKPKLLKFMGRPDELTPKAKIRTWLGQPEPFDRHDWTVDRGGKLVRYVIDYYFDEEKVKLDSVPKDLNDQLSVKSIRVDARPALDSVEAIVDRCLYMPFRRMLGKTTYSPPAMLTDIRLFSPAPARVIKKDPLSEQRDLLQQQWATIQEKCEAAKTELAQCTNSENEGECRGAKSVALQRCTASVVCPDIVKVFDDAVKASDRDLDAIDRAYVSMGSCLDQFYIDSKQHLLSSPGDR